MKIYIAVSNCSGFQIFKAEDASQALGIAIGYNRALYGYVPEGLEVHLLDSYMEVDDIFDAKGSDFIT